MNARDPRRARGGDDAGITLAELIVSITIMAFIVSAITFALVVALKNSRANQDRLDAGGGAQLLAAFFPSDVASADPTGATSTDPGATTGCPDPDPGRNVLLFRLDGALADTISYRVVPDGSLAQIVRVVCVGGVARRNAVAFNVTDDASVTASVENGPSGALVGATLQASVGRQDAVPLAVSGRVRARDKRDTSMPCTMATVTPYSLVVDSGGRVVADMVFDLYPLGDCGALSLRIPNPGGSPTTVTVNGASSVEFWEVPIARSTAVFQPGSVTAVVLSDGAPVWTFPLTITREPCSVRSVEPSSLEFDTNFRVSADTPFRVRTNGACSQVALYLPTGIGGNPNPFRLNLTSSSGLWTGTLRPSDALPTWATVDAGMVEVRAGTSSPQTLIGMSLLDARPKPCTVTSVSPLQAKTDLSQRLAGTVTLRVRTAGFCGTRRVTIQTGGTPPVFEGDLVPDTVAGQWKIDIPRDGQTWSEGDHAAAVTDAGAPVVNGPFVFRTLEGCSTLLTLPQNLTINGAGRLTAPADMQITTSGNCNTVSLSMPTGFGTTTITVPLTGPSPWTAPIDASTAQWTPGPHTITVTMVDPFGTTTSVFTLTLAQPGCIVTGFPNRIDVSSSNRIRSGQQLSFPTTGPCGTTMTVQFTPPGTAVPTAITLAASPTSPTNWQTVNLPTDPWRRNQSTTVYVYAAPTTGPLDATTLAGEFTVEGR